MRPHVSYVWYQDQFCVALLVTKGPKYITGIRAADAKVIRIPHRNARSEVEFKGRPYPVKRAAKSIRRLARKLNDGSVPKGVSRLLMRAQA